MKKLALATAFAVLTLASTAVLANSSVTVGTGLTATGSVGGNWISNSTSDTFTIFNPDSLIMIVHVTSLIKDPTSSDDLSNYQINCNPTATPPAPVLVTAGSSYICRTNTNVTITSDGNATSTAAMGTYQVIFEKAPPCTTNCKNMLKK